MSLMSAMSAALSGLRTTQAGIDLVSQNVANAGSVGYTRRQLSPVQTLAGDQTAGVRTGEVQRVLDVAVQRQLRLETAGAAYTSLMADVAKQLDGLFGAPGGANSLDGAVNAFSQALQGLLSNPGDYAARGAVLDRASSLASRLGSLSDSVQALRTDAEARLASATSRVNELLSSIEGINRRVIASNNAGTPSPALEDERDRIIAELSQYMDVETRSAQNGSVTVSTTSGLTLFNGTSAARFEFDARGTLSPQSQYATDEALRTVGTLRMVSPGGGSSDVVAQGLIRSGEIAAALELRDTTLVQAQRQLDELAAGLSRALSDRDAPVAAATVGAQTGFDIDMTGWQPGNAITLDYRDTASGAARRVILVPSNSPTPAISGNDVSDPSATVIRVDMSGGFGAAAAAIQGELTARGIALTVSSPAANTFRFLDDGAANTTDVNGVSAGITVTSLTGGTPELPLFVDKGYANTPFTGSFEGRSHLTGLAQRLAVNPQLIADRSRLVVYNTAPPTLQGDTVRATHLVDALTKDQRIFSAASGIGGLQAPYTGSVAQFARQVVETQGAQSEGLNRLNEGQKVALATVQGRFSEVSGVNIDEEMAQLVQLQTAYGANARIMTAVRDMLDTLLRI